MWTVEETAPTTPISVFVADLQRPGRTKIPGDNFSVMKDPADLAAHLAKRLSLLAERQETVVVKR